jgi:hypothetical protein
MNTTIVGEDRKYKKTEDGTCYHAETTDEMIGILQRLRLSQERVRFHWGDTTGEKAGYDWGDTYDVKGRIGRSMGGRFRIPLLIYNARSMGGGGILTDCIVKITATNGGRVIYQHPKYHETIEKVQRAI